MHRRPACLGGRGDEILPLGDEQPRPRALTPAGELADLLELRVVGTGDGHGVIGHEKGAFPEGEAPVRSCVSAEV
jgi:hypothetical protein